jgi:hypothetical protein
MQVVRPVGIKLCDLPERFTNLLQDEAVNSRAFLKNFADCGEG